MNIKTILVPCDFSENSMAGIDYARDLARKFKAKIVLAHVSPSAERLVVYGPPPAHLPKDLEDTVAEGVERGFAELKGRFSASDDMATVHLRGEPAAELVDHAKQSDVDLIVMSTHGRTGIGHLVLGSVAERVVRTATCPVVTIKPKIKVKAGN
jgi:nucleotide-binding universal stress UspA family protein